MLPGNKRSVDIVEYSARFGNAFERLNVEWLEQYFEVEPIDRQILSDPVGTIIAPGGAILYALVGRDVVGTVALKLSREGVYELTKMAVTGPHQGLGVGRRLLEAAIRRYQDMGGEKLYLESHSSLTKAILLYESAGFRHESPPGPSAYSRADIFMVYRGDGAVPA